MNTPIDEESVKVYCGLCPACLWTVGDKIDVEGPWYAATVDTYKPDSRRYSTNICHDCFKKWQWLLAYQHEDSLHQLYLFEPSFNDQEYILGDEKILIITVRRTFPSY